MPPVAAAVPWIVGAAKVATAVAGIAGAATSVVSAVQSNKQAKEAEKRQNAYYNQLQQEQAATAAKEKQLTNDAKERSRLYGASLIDTGTQLKNMLSGGYDDEDYTGGTILTSSLTSANGGVASIFA